jgi:hypothetical protein
VPKEPKDQETTPKLGLFTQTIDGLRENAPDVVVNESARFSFGLRVIANALSVKSGLRSGALTDEALHAPYFKANPELLPKGVGKYTAGMEHARFASPRRAVAGSISLAGVALAAIYGEQQQTAEELESYKEMPLGDYVSMRVRHAFQPHKHAAATVGMADIANGVFTVGAGLAQFNGFHGKFSWKQVPYEALKGCITIASGMAMQFMPDQQKAWQLSQSIMLVRTPLTAAHSWRAWQHGIPGKVDPREWEQPTKFALNHASNYFGMVFGCVEKHDGQIISAREKHDAPDATIALPAKPQPLMVSEAKAIVS